ncbi:MAG: hydroxymethylbilane synthase [Acidimicrobiales bacterium]|nr:hydroxymethylbilane synthase [Acidimicrobiales bacterium]
MRIATRGSPLARWQAAYVADRLRAAGAVGPVDLVVVETTGDQRADQPVWEIGGQGVFVKEVQAAVLDGRADLAVHSAKDLPSRSHPDLTIGAVPPRADPRDALVGTPLSSLAPGAPVATGSVRRRAQLAWLRPDLTFTSLRGNIAARLGKVPPGGAVVVAQAALDRLGLASCAAEILPVSVMLPQVGQGAIAVECRVEDESGLAALATIDDPAAHLCADAERAFLARLGGGCDLPVGAYAQAVGPETVQIEAMMASPDGRVVLRAALEGPRSSGEDVAEQLLQAGGRELLSS